MTYELSVGRVRPYPLPTASEAATDVFDPFMKKTSQGWIGRLAHYASHRNDEHCLALVDEAIRYTGLHLENDLACSDFWNERSLLTRAGLLLFLVDRGVVERSTRRGRRVYEPLPHAESWVASQSVLRPKLRVILEFLAALRNELKRRAHTPHA